MSTEIPLMIGMQDAIENLSIYKTDSQPAPDSQHREIAMSSREFGNYLVIWEITYNDTTGMMDDQQYKTARRVNKTDGGTRQKWTDWNANHNNLADAIESALIDYGRGKHPQVEDVWMIQSQMITEGITTWKGIK